MDRRAARTLYFGGGTPSLLEPGQMDTLIQAAGKFFGLAGDAEITLEANPESAVSISRSIPEGRRERCEYPP